MLKKNIFLISALLLWGFFCYYSGKEKNISGGQNTTVIEQGASLRSPQWQTLRKYYLISNPRCEACGARIDLEVHHIKPFHLFPEHELNWGNLITLCSRHHFELGHKGNWKDYNLEVKEDSKKIKDSNKVIDK